MGSLSQSARQLYAQTLEGSQVSLPHRFLLWLVYVLYHSARLIKSSLYSLRILPRRRLSVPTISVGNPTMGGAGKTPITAWLARVLGQPDRRPVILSRGYRRGAHRWMTLVSHGGKLLTDSLEAGDEPYLLARKLPEASVISGKRRASTGRVAIKNLDPGFIILDDGQQYYRLQRDLDISLVDLPLRPSQFRLFPFGELREPLSRLARSDLIVLTRADQTTANQRDAAVRFLDSTAPRIPRAWASFVVLRVRELGSANDVSVSSFKDRRLLALANIAKPGGFHRILNGWAPTSVCTVSFPDHHRYDVKDEVRILTEVIRNKVDCVVMTEKDEVNLPPGFRLTVPAFVVEVDLEIRGDGFEIVPFLEEKLFKKSQDYQYQSMA